MSKLLFFDIDGTLAYPGYPPSTATVEAIQAARRNGHKVFISTGRTMDSISMYLTGLQISVILCRRVWTPGSSIFLPYPEIIISFWNSCRMTASSLFLKKQKRYWN